MGKRSEGGEEKRRKRRSKDKKVNVEGRLLLEKIKELGWVIWNEDIKGDEEREWTYRRARSISDRVCIKGSRNERIRGKNGGRRSNRFGSPFNGDLD